MGVLGPDCCSLGQEGGGTGARASGQSAYRRMLSGMDELVMARTRRSTSSTKRTDRKGLMTRASVPFSLFHSSGLCLPSAPLPQGRAWARLRTWARGLWSAKQERVAKVTRCPHNPRQCLPLPLVP